jgi:allantoicase
MEITKTEQPTFTSLIDLASEKLGGKALVCSDDFFAEKENLLKPGRGIFITDKYTDRGKWTAGSRAEKGFRATTGVSLNLEHRESLKVWISIPTSF